MFFFFAASINISVVLLRLSSDSAIAAMSSAYAVNDVIGFSRPIFNPRGK